MRTEKTAKKLVEGLKRQQLEHKPMHCPRCGNEMLNTDLARNSLSRRADIYICNICGTEEAILDACGKEPLPLTEWAAAKKYLTN